MHIMRKRHRAAFTLIELLVVVAILSLLVAMMMPALARAREFARRSQCQANYHAMGLGIHVFAAEHDGRAPGCAAYIPNSTDGVTSSWIGILNKEHFGCERIAGVTYTSRYLERNRGKIHCPSVVPWGSWDYRYWAMMNNDVHGGEHVLPWPDYRVTSTNSSGFYGKVVRTPAGYDQRMAYHLGTRLGDFPKASWKVMLFEAEDSGMAILRPSHAVDVGWQSHGGPPYQYGHHAMRHLRTETMAFIDGHVQSMRPTDQLDRADRYYLNR